MIKGKEVRSMLVLLGGFALAYNLTIALHELGHATTVLIGGGAVQQFVLNPFSWSWNLGQNIPDIRFTAWGGVTFGLAFTLFPLVFLHWIRSNTGRFLLKLLAACGLLINGIYLLAGVMGGFGDGGELARLGVAKGWVIMLGAAYLAASFVPWSNLQSHLGLDARTSYPARLRVMLGGITPYMLAILVYNAVFNPGQMAIWGGFAVAGMALAGLFALIGHGYSRLRPDNEAEGRTIASPGVLMIAGTLVILTEFLVFGIPKHPF